MTTWYKLYNPEGIRTPDNPCDCGHCGRYRELYHAIPYEGVFTKDINRIKRLKLQYPDGVVYEIVYANDQFIGEISCKRIEI